jgi:hypothetical protein
MRSPAQTRREDRKSGRVTKIINQVLTCLILAVGVVMIVSAVCIDRWRRDFAEECRTLRVRNIDNGETEEAWLPQGQDQLP